MYITRHEETALKGTAEGETAEDMDGDSESRNMSSQGSYNTRQITFLEIEQ